VLASCTRIWEIIIFLHTIDHCYPKLRIISVVSIRAKATNLVLNQIFYPLIYESYPCTYIIENSEQDRLLSRGVFGDISYCILDNSCRIFAQPLGST
jgi:hypothetical protein